jgi:hypothetical protein
LVPWWSLGFWSAPPSPDQAPASPRAVAEPPAFLLSNWTAAFSVDVDARQLGLGVALASALPVVREGGEQDVDGLSGFALPDLSFQAALGEMTAAIQGMKEAEVDYREALTQQVTISSGGQVPEIISLLKKPLLLDTADADEQVRAADAQVRQAEADLDAARHESTASEFEAASVVMLYKASEVEVLRQKVLGQIATLETQVKQLEEQAAAIDVDNAHTEEDKVKLLLRKAQTLQQAAQVRLDMATQSRSLVREQIELLELLLNKDIPVTLPDSSQHTVPGQIAAMGLKIEFSLRKKLADDEADARIKLQAAQEEEERRRELERQASFIKGILSFAGAVVGVVLGGPSGAALGSSIAGAAGDLVAGIIEKKPVEEIIVGLVGDTFTVAKAAGVNLDGLLAQVGSLAGEEADQLFKKFDSSLKPVLDDLPRVLDESLVRGAFKDLDISRVPGLDSLIADALQGLRTNSPSFGNLKDVLSQAGVQSPIGFEDSNAFQRNLAAGISASLRANPTAREAIRNVVGMAELVLNDQIREAGDRLSKLVMTRLGLGANGYASDVLKNWIIAKQKAQLSWNQVSREGDALLEQLYPDPQARSVVQANVRLTLLDPRTFQAEVQSFLGPWQQELDKRVAAVKDAGEQALSRTKQPTDPVGAAQARLDYILASQDKFFDSRGLLVFLQGKDSPQRLELVRQLQDRRDQDHKEQAGIKLEQLNVDASTTDVNVAQLGVKQAEANLQRAEDFFTKSKIEVEEATLQTKVNDLAEQHVEDTSAAQQKASQSADEKVKATAARVEAARASLDSRRALYAGAKLRAAEASRIRESLSQPPLRLPAEDAIRGTIAFASVRHADTLERGLRASRQILRLLRAAQIPQHDWPRPDASLGNPQAARTPWSDSLASQSRGFTELFQRPTAQSAEIGAIKIRLGAPQVQALLTAGGLKVLLRPGVSAVTMDDRIQENILDATAGSGRIIALLLAGKVKDGGASVFMTGQHYHPSAEYRGDRWVSGQELHLIDVRRLQASRVSLMDPGLDPTDFVVRQGELKTLQGDPKFNDVQGTPTSGTTVIRLEKVNPLVIDLTDGLELTILHSFFD